MHPTESWVTADLKLLRKNLQVVPANLAQTQISEQNLRFLISFFHLFSPSVVPKCFSFFKKDDSKVSTELQLICLRWAKSSWQREALRMCSWSMYQKAGLSGGRWQKCHSSRNLMEAKINGCPYQPGAVGAHHECWQLFLAHFLDSPLCDLNKPLEYINTPFPQSPTPPK